MRIGGFQKVSLIDFPGKVAAVVFTQGCNFRCRYCHNMELVLPSFFRDIIPEEDILQFLSARSDKLQGVVITGGEPTVQGDLPDFIRTIKAMGYAVKLDTNGSRPGVLKELICRNLLDFIAMDIKAPIGRYPEICGVKVNPANIRESIDIILKSTVSHQFRTTFPKPLLGEEDLPGISSLLKNSKDFVLQPFVPRKEILDSSLLDKAHYEEEEFRRLCEKWAGQELVRC